MLLYIIPAYASDACRVDCSSSTDAAESSYCDQLKQQSDHSHVDRCTGVTGRCDVLYLMLAYAGVIIQRLPASRAMLNLRPRGQLKASFCLYSSSTADTKILELILHLRIQWQALVTCRPSQYCSDTAPAQGPASLQLLYHFSLKLPHTCEI